KAWRLRRICSRYGQRIGRKGDTPRLTRGLPTCALSSPSSSQTTQRPDASGPIRAHFHRPVTLSRAHVRIGISNVISMAETGFWRSPSMLSWWRRRRPSSSQTGERARRLVFVLGGGGSRGACSVGVLKALLEAGIKPDGLVGCSSGAFNAVALAAKPDLETIEQLAHVWGSIRNRDLFDRNPLRMAYRYMRSRNSFFDSRYLRTPAAEPYPDRHPGAEHPDHAWPANAGRVSALRRAGGDLPAGSQRRVRHSRDRLQSGGSPDRRGLRAHARLSTGRRA